MSYQTVSLTESNKVWTLTIQRPEALNALNSQVLQDLSQALDEIEKKSFSEARALILTGAGEKAFVAGADIKEIGSLDTASAKTFAERGQSLFRRLEKLKIPVIAAVNGFALGGGLELALSCDYIFASENAKFGLPEVSLGLIPGFGGTVRLSRAVGLPRAKELIFTGRMLTADEALKLGVALKVVPQSELLAACLQSVEGILSKGPVAVSKAKESIMRTYDLDIESAMQAEAQMFTDLFKTSDVKEGTSAFVEKRKAQFLGK